MRFSSRPCTATEECQIFTRTGPTKDTKQRQEQNDINFENEDNNNNTSTENDNTDTGYVSGYSSAEDEAADGVVKDDQKVLAEMETATFEKPPPRIVDVGMIGEGKRAERGSSWRRVWRAKVYPLWMNSNQT